MTRSRSLPALVFLALLAAGAGRAAAADRLEIERDGDALRLEVDAPASAVLERLRAVGGLDLIVQGEATQRVRLACRGVSAETALRRVAAAAGLQVQRFEGAAGGGRRPLFVLSAPVRRRQTAAIEPVPGRRGLWRMPGALDHPVRVLTHDRSDAPLRAALGQLEAATQTALVVSPSTRAAALRDFARHRSHYVAICERAGLALPLPHALSEREVRVYLERGSGLVLVEALFAAGPRHVGRLVWTVRARDERILQLTIGRWTVLPAAGQGDRPR